MRFFKLFCFCCRLLIVNSYQKASPKSKKTEKEIPYKNCANKRTKLILLYLNGLGHNTVTK